MDSFIGLTDTEVLDRANKALTLAAALKPGTKARAREWQRFDAAMGELARRAMSRALWVIHEAEKED
jgi:hypothetical protein